MNIPATVIAEGKRLADNVRLAEARVIATIEDKFDELREFGQTFNSLRPRDQKAILAELPPENRKIVRLWSRLAKDEGAFRVRLLEAQLAFIKNAGGGR